MTVPKHSAADHVVTRKCIRNLELEEFGFKLDYTLYFITVCENLVLFCNYCPIVKNHWFVLSEFSGHQVTWCSMKNNYTSHNELLTLYRIIY